MVLWRWGGGGWVKQAAQSQSDTPPFPALNDLTVEVKLEGICAASP